MQPGLTPLVGDLTVALRLDQSPRILPIGNLAASLNRPGVRRVRYLALAVQNFHSFERLFGFSLKLGLDGVCWVLLSLCLRPGLREAIAGRRGTFVRILEDGEVKVAPMLSPEL